MRPVSRGVLVMILAAGLACCANLAPPPRPAAVPPSAVWAGGADGGSWIDCRWTTKEPVIAYDCRVYDDPSGDLSAEGYYVLGRCGREFEPEPGGPFGGGTFSSYDAFDGTVIFVSRARCLVPHGKVKYPVPGAASSIVTYDFGRAVDARPN